MKAFHLHSMYHALFIVMSFISIDSLSQVSLHDLNKKKGIYFLNNTPYTGEIEDYFFEIGPNGEEIKNIELTGAFINGKKDGKWTHYDGSNIYNVSNYNKGSREGIWYSYNSNGLIYLESSYLNNKKNGLWKAYDSNGNLTQSVSYSNGKYKDATYTKYYKLKKLRIGIEGGVNSRLLGASFTYNINKKHGIYSSFNSFKYYHGTNLSTVLDTGIYSLNYPGNVLTDHSLNVNKDNGYLTQIGYTYEFFSRWSFAMHALVSGGLSSFERTNYTYIKVTSTSGDEFWVSKTNGNLSYSEATGSIGLLTDIDFVHFYFGYQFNPNIFKMGVGFKF